MKVWMTILSTAERQKKQQRGNVDENVLVP